MTYSRAALFFSFGLLAVSPGFGQTLTGEPLETRKPEISYSSPAWSRDGRHIAFARDSDKAYSQIVVASANGRHPKRYSARPAFDPQAKPKFGFYEPGKATHPVWSPDGRKIAFVEERMWNGGSSYPEFRLLVLTLSSGRVRVMNAPVAELSALAWSPDSRTIAVAASRNVFLGPSGENKERRGDIWILEANSNQRWRIAPSPGDVAYLSWSPEGKRLVFTARPEWDRTRAQVILTGKYGRRLSVLSREPADHFFVAWSPDSSRIAFPVRRGQNGVDLLIHPYASGVDRRLHGIPALPDLLGVRWGTRGQILCAVDTEIPRSGRSERRSALSVMAIDPRTGWSRSVARAALGASSLDWSPNGRFLAFQAYDHHKAEQVYRLDLRTRKVRQLSREGPSG